MTSANSATVSMIIGQPISPSPGEPAGGEQERGSERDGAFERVFARGLDDEAARPEERGPDGRAAEPSAGSRAEVGARRVDRHPLALGPSNSEDAADKTLSDLAIPAFAVQPAEDGKSPAAGLSAPASAVGTASSAAGAIDAAPGETDIPRAAAVSIETPGHAIIKRPSEPLGTTSVDGVKTTTKPPAAPQAGQPPAAGANVAVSVSVQPRAAEPVPQSSAAPPVIGAATGGESVASESASRSVAQDGVSAAKVSVSVGVKPRAANPSPPAPQLSEAGGAEMKPHNVKTETSSADVDLVDQAKQPLGPRAQAEPLRVSTAATAFGTGAGQRNAVGLIPAAADIGEAAVSEIDIAAPTDSAQTVRGAGPRPMSVAMGAVAIQIQNQVEILTNGRTVHVRLDPPNLGSFEVRLELSGTAVHAVVSSDRADTLELLARHRNELITILADAGFDVLDARFEGGGESPPDVGEEELLAAESLADAEEIVPSPTPWVPSSWLETGGRLDIRV